MTALRKIVPLDKPNRRDFDGRGLRPWDGGLVQSPEMPGEQLTRYRLISERREDIESFWRAVELYQSETDEPLILPNAHEGNIRINARAKNAVLIVRCLAKAAHIAVERGWSLSSDVP